MRGNLNWTRRVQRKARLYSDTQWTEGRQAISHTLDEGGTGGTQPLNNELMVSICIYNGNVRKYALIRVCLPREEKTAFLQHPRLP